MPQQLSERTHTHKIKSGYYINGYRPGTEQLFLDEFKELKIAYGVKCRTTKANRKNLEAMSVEPKHVQRIRRYGFLRVLDRELFHKSKDWYSHTKVEQMEVPIKYRNKVINHYILHTSTRVVIIAEHVDLETNTCIGAMPGKYPDITKFHTDLYIYDQSIDQWYFKARNADYIVVAKPYKTQPYLSITGLTGTTRPNDNAKQIIKNICNTIKSYEPS